MLASLHARYRRKKFTFAISPDACLICMHRAAFVDGCLKFTHSQYALRVQCRSNLTLDLMTSCILFSCRFFPRCYLARVLTVYLTDHNIDVCCVTETWLNNSIPDSFVCPKDYVVYRHDRCSVGGGVAVFVKNAICSVAVDIGLPAEYQHVEVVCVDLSF